MIDPPRSAYLHVPFCTHRCGYCNFTVIAGRDDLTGAYLNAIEKELEHLETPHQVDTLFLGGGTPTHLSPSELQRLLTLATKWFPLAPEAEMSVEANPIDITAEKVELLAAAGVNRVSLGVQSFHDTKLKLLERDHRRAEIELAASLILPKIPNLGIDLIFAAPGETLPQWQADLQSAVELGAQHISTYGLTFEKGTSFWNRRERSQLREADEELQREMYLAAIDQLTSAGLEHYEVSNFARPGFRSQHNQQYWLGRRYFAAGPGASRHIEMRRETNHRSTTTYIKRIQQGQSPVAEQEMLTPEMKAREQLVFGLRMLNGIHIPTFQQDTGTTPEQLCGAILPQFQELGLLSLEDDHLRLTRDGLLLSDTICVELL
ncbi:radical SAM family heme chaperone HemW [Blastopirellula marina]|uniref:Heme chaperone HemW n=1 Tax=Blastopirellula marina TaxID=124 RepID=A0A2S8F4F1_9BACT|nr:radical SAM family heme chaperone HemW [Blastopirellula marina]PQO27042.1 coproporphyrinogen III oxidase [Blastopirellula marina]PTL41189.1 coproporphyrinogen III oxidase family protein [Blastopirellula marina]